ncbi:hypothetical protein [Streptomyces sp. YIM S03343]
MIRLRIQVAHCPHRALVLTDTPRPDCDNCQGEGGTARDYGHPETGEYDGTDYEICDCWNDSRRWTLLPLPRMSRWLHRHGSDRSPWTHGGYSDEPPF